MSPSNNTSDTNVILEVLNASENTREYGAFAPKEQMLHFP